MDDINFDELDKAVNSVLHTDTDAPTPVDPVARANVFEPFAPVLTPEPSTQTSSSEPKASVAPVSTTDGAVADQSATKPITPLAMPVKRRGQFMDMVHPSSDMMSPSREPQQPASTPIRRQTQVVKPLDPSIVEVGTSAKPQEEESAQSIEKTTEPTTEGYGDVAIPDYSENYHQKNEWPDPLDVATESYENSDIETEQNDNSATLNRHSAEVAEAEGGFSSEPQAVSQAEHNSEDARDEDDPQASQSSPFIEGTEVEKRPLGAFADTNEKNDDVFGEPHPAEVAEMPVELSSEVVLVESDDRVFQEDDTSEDTSESNNEPVKEEKKPESNVAQSIPQQYRVAPSGNEDDEHSVFDTKQYHQPLTSPAKKHKSHVMVYILIGILMLGIGAALGYLVFVMKII